MTRPRVVDESPISEFVGKMVEAHKRRLKATTVAEKRAIEREMEEFLRNYLGQHAKVVEQPTVPRDTSSDQNCPISGASSEPRDGKVLAAGRD